MISKLKNIISFINNHPVAKRHKIRAYYNLFHWQLSQAFSSKGKIVHFIKPARLFVKKGMTGATGNIYTGLHEFSDMGFLLHFLRERDLFFDIGANVGAYSVLAAAVKRANVVSFEPVPSTYSALQKNIELNNINGLVCALNIGVGATQSIMKFTSELDTVNHVVADDSWNSNHVEIKVDCLDNLIAKHGCPALIKIDVEGFETEVVRGMQTVLQNDNLQAIIIELNGSAQRYGYDEMLIHEKLLLHGFNPYLYFPLERRLQQLNIFGSHNTIYIRDIDFVKKRVMESEPFEVFKELI